VILVEIRPRGGRKKTTVAVHPRVTVLRGLDAAARRTWATDLGRALQGGTTASLDVEVEIGGRREVLTPQVAAELGLDNAGCEVTVFAVDLPGARPIEAPAPMPVVVEDDPETEKAETVHAEAAARADTAERAASDAAAERAAVAASIDREAAAAVPRHEAAVEAARGATERARRALADVETRIRRVQEEWSADRAELRARSERLESERAKLEAARAELVVRMVETGDPGDPKPVEEALSGLRRLRSVKPKPSTRGIELADAWVEARQRLAALPAPPQPPEWLVTPALEALQEAREALAAAERGGEQLDVDPSDVEALERAHREVLETEQRAMKKGSRTNRRRLDSAHAVEQAALRVLGATSYGDYLQRIAPNIGGPSTSNEDRLAAARAAVADAEAVWEELHGGQASPEWTEAKQQQAAVRNEALALIGSEVDDSELEDRLRTHLETVVDTGWAEQALSTALHRAGVVGLDDEADIEIEADRWLAGAPPAREARATLERELEELDTRLAVVEEQLTEQRANAPAGDDDDEEPTPNSIDGSATLPELRAAVATAERAEDDAEAGLEAARARVVASDEAQTRLAALERAAAERGREADERRAEVTAAESALAARRDARESPSAGRAGANGSVDLSGVVGMEAEAYLLARVAALRGAAGGPLPLVLDAGVLDGLSERASKRVFRLLGRLADSMQLVVLGDDGEIANWAKGLGDRAAVRSVAR
jgi:hypothetical protein